MNWQDLMHTEQRCVPTTGHGHPLRILFLAPLVDIGTLAGDSVHVSKVAALLAKKHGCSVTLICKQSKGQFNLGEGIRIVRVPRIFFLSIGMALLKGLCDSRDHDYDVILERGWYLSPGLLASRILSTPLAIEADGFTFEYYKFKSTLHRMVARFIGAIESQVYRSADLVIATSSSVMNVVQSMMKVPQSRIVRIDNGADVSTCTIDAEGRDSSRTVFCFVGAFERWQGLETVLEAFSLSPSLSAKASVFLVGDGLLMANIRRTIAERGLDACFHILGRVPHDRALAVIARSDACLAPLDKGKCGPSLKLFEYMSMGKPVIASRTIDHLFIEDEGIGLLFEPGDPLDLARCLEEFIEKREEYAVNAMKGVRLVREKYNWESTVAALFKTLSNLSSGALDVR